MKQLKLLFSSHPGKGISNWFARGGQLIGSSEVLTAFDQMLQKDIDQTGLRIVREVLPYALLFDSISIVTGTPFSDPFLRDLDASLGVKLINPDSLSSFAPSKEETKDHLAAITHNKDAATLIPMLYRMAGPFAADLPDLLPVIYSMILSIRLSKSLSARLNCPDSDLEIHKIIAEEQTYPKTDERLEVMQKVFSFHELPLLTIDAFRDNKQCIDLDRLFTCMKMLRQSHHIIRFREKLSEFSKSQEDVDQVISKDILRDLRTSLEEYVIQPQEIRNRFTKAILMDVIGYFIPASGTVEEAASIAYEKIKSSSLEWRLFVFEYGDQLTKVSI